VPHAGGEFGRFIESRAVLDPVLEQHEVGGHAWPQQTPVAQAEALGRNRRHAPHRILEREPMPLPPKPAGDARECPVGARMRLGTGPRQAVGPHHMQAMRAGGVEVLVVKLEHHDGGLSSILLDKPHHQVERGDAVRDGCLVDRLALESLEIRIAGPGNAHITPADQHDL
jgi:hypothetical protein